MEWSRGEVDTPPTLLNHLRQHGFVPNQANIEVAMAAKMLVVIISSGSRNTLTSAQLTSVDTGRAASPCLAIA